MIPPPPVADPPPPPPPHVQALVPPPQITRETPFIGFEDLLTGDDAVIPALPGVDPLALALQLLSWSLNGDIRVDVPLHVTGLKCVLLAATKFQGYAAVWWHDLEQRRVVEGLPPIQTWAELKALLLAAFLPATYERDLFTRV